VIGNPTEELCAKLDEMGVEYDSYDLPNGNHGVSWIDGNNIEWEVVPLGENFEIHALQLVTPEQAISATVGRWNLTAEQVRECVKEVYFEGYSDGATHRVNGIEETDWQAIADKLNATLCAGTCRNKGFVDDGGWYFVCSECGCEFEYGDFACEFAEGHGLGSPKFCPNCGAMVVVE
jgi:hypothetical protein